ncbi:hypothetical protein Tco_0877450 [Tanacetum coccineum]|uniref:Xylulose kinase-1 n=1 Tax=Tanacetum coccineum TaxID=301880 RepID=A0ABQ5C0W3_9ASTR
MVAYLKKPSGSEGFQEILDFLNDSHIRYALTKNPIIYVSLIKQFWQTGTVRTVDNREQEITATVDGKEFTIIEAYVRRHLQLANIDGFLNPHNREYIAPTFTPKLFSNMKRGFSGEHAPLFPSMLAIQAEDGEGLGHPSEPQPPPSTAQPINEEPIPNVVSSSHQKTQTPRQALNQDTKLPQTSVPIPNVPDEVVCEEWDDRVERATTTAASLDAEQASGNIDKTQSTAMPNGRMIEEINQDAGITLVTPTKFSSQEDQLEDQLGVLSAAKVLADAAKKNVYTYTRRRRAFSTSSGGVSTASRLFSTAKESVSTTGASMPVSTAGMVQEVNISIPSPVVVKDKAQSFTKEEWENIKARVEVDEELSKKLQAEERNKYSKLDQAKMLVDLINQKKKLLLQRKIKQRGTSP